MKQLKKLLKVFGIKISREDLSNEAVNRELKKLVDRRIAYSVPNGKPAWALAQGLVESGECWIENKYFSIRFVQPAGHTGMFCNFRGRLKVTVTNSNGMGTSQRVPLNSIKVDPEQDSSKPE